MHDMSNVPPVRNEPTLTYAPGSPERAEIKRALEQLRGEQPEVPLVIGGRERTTNEVREQREPHLRERVCATWSAAGPAEACAGHRRRAGGAARLEHAARWPTARPCCCAPPTCWRARGGSASTPRRCSARARRCARPRSTRPRSSPTSGASTSTSPRRSPSSSRSRRPASTTAWSSAASRASSTRSRRSTSRPSAATCRPRRR